MSEGQRHIQLYASDLIDTINHFNQPPIGQLKPVLATGTVNTRTVNTSIDHLFAKVRQQIPPLPVAFTDLQNNAQVANTGKYNF